MRHMREVRGQIGKKIILSGLRSLLVHCRSDVFCVIRRFSSQDSDEFLSFLSPRTSLAVLIHYRKLQSFAALLNST